MRKIWYSTTSTGSVEPECPYQQKIGDKIIHVGSSACIIDCNYCHTNKDNYPDECSYVICLFEDGLKTPNGWVSEK